MLVNDGFGLNGYNTLILPVLQHAAQADHFHPLGKIATTAMYPKLYQIVVFRAL
jgi:hypothetical protein